MGRTNPREFTGSSGVLPDEAYNIDKASSEAYNPQVAETQVISIVLRIRLRRIGAKKRPFYRIMVADARSPRNGAYVEQLGHYDPLTDPPTIVLDDDKARSWLNKGAQPSDPVAYILRSRGILSKD